MNINLVLCYSKCFFMQDNSNTTPLEALQEIKKMMQQSTRIFSLSGWSGVWAGIVALVGAYVFYFIKYNTGSLIHLTSNQYPSASGEDMAADLVAWRQNFHLDTAQKELLLWASIAIFIVAVAGAVFFTFRKNRLKGYANQYNTIARKLLINLSIPMGVGAVFCLHFLNIDAIENLVPCTLVFYGLALINGSKYTFSDIKYLGLLEVILGLISLLWMQYHLLIWALGFGVLHIGYGIYMWTKYDKK